MVGMSSGNLLDWGKRFGFGFGFGFGLGALLAFGGGGADAADLNISWGVNNEAPYAIVQDGRLVGGLIKDIGDRTAQKIGARAIYTNIPRTEVDEALRSGETDIRCMTSPKYLRNAPLFIWTDEYMIEQDVFALRAGTEPVVRSIRDLDGKAVGAITGYVYAKPLTDAITAGRIRRIDSPSLTASLAALAAGKVDAVVGSDILLGYTLSRNAQPGVTLVLSPYVLSRNNLHCAISPRADPAPDSIRNTINGLITDGFIADRVAFYRGQPKTP
jgi:ABC-type amino acid transport substrate-binding protein